MKAVALAVLLALASALAALSSGADELKLVSGSSSTTVCDNCSGDLNSTSGTIIYTNSDFNGWTLNVVSGVSRAPETHPFALDILSLTATCDGGDCTRQPLELWYSDINFADQISGNGFVTDFSTTQTGGETATESAWFSNSNLEFDQQSLIGTIGPFSSSSVGSITTGPISVASKYSLTLEQVFTDASGSDVSFSADGDITAAPEPAAIVLLGTALLLCGAGLRRRKR